MNSPIFHPFAQGRTPPRLEQLAAAGLLQYAAETAAHADGGSPLFQAAATLWPQDPAAAEILRAQCLAIHALSLARNRGLAEYLLPGLLAGERAACVALQPGHAVLQGQDSGRGWRLSGLLGGLANLQPDGFSVLTAVTLGEGAGGWVVLRSEEDGLDVLPPHPACHRPWARPARLGEVRCRAVFFREDEWLGDEDLAPRLRALAARLSPAPDQSTL